MRTSTTTIRERIKDEIDVFRTEAQAGSLSRFDPPDPTGNSEAMRDPAADSTGQPAQPIVPADKTTGGKKTETVAGQYLSNALDFEVRLCLLRVLYMAHEFRIRGHHCLVSNG